MMMLLVRGSRRPPLAVVVLGQRAMGTGAKGTTRAAVHGSRSPTNTTVEGKEEAEEKIERGKEEQQKMREHVEAKLDDAASSPAPPPHSKSAK